MIYTSLPAYLCICVICLLSVRLSLFRYNSVLPRASHLPKFWRLSQRYSRKFRSSVMWRYAAGWVVPHVSKGRIASIFNGSEVQEEWVMFDLFMFSTRRSIWILCCRWIGFFGGVMIPSRDIYLHKTTQTTNHMHPRQLISHKKVKQSRYRPGVAQRFPGS